MKNMHVVKPIGRAKFSRLSNDLFWEYRGFDSDREWVSVTWSGYNDAYWWNEVAPTEDARTLKGQNGRLYRIDFKTNEVWEVEQ